MTAEEDALERWADYIEGAAPSLVSAMVAEQLTRLVDQRAIYRNGAAVVAAKEAEVDAARATLSALQQDVSDLTAAIAEEDAAIAALQAQKAALQAELQTIADGQAILDTIADGRTALAAGTIKHYLMPRTIARGTSGPDQTAAIQAWLNSIADGAGPFTPRVVHSWRNVSYRVDGTLTLTSRANFRWDGHGSPLVAMAVGAGSRTHLRIDSGSHVWTDRLAIRGSLPAGAPAFSSTYANQHGIEILGGSNITIRRPDVVDVYGSSIRVAPNAGGDVPTTVKVQGVGTEFGRVDRAGNHALAVVAATGFSWEDVPLGACGRETIALLPGAGQVITTASILRSHITGAVTDTARRKIVARSAGRILGLTLDGIVTEAAAGPLTGDVAATTAGSTGADLIIKNTVGAGSLVNSGRSAWVVENYEDLSFRSNVQAMQQVSGANVMYGLKGTGITGTKDVGGNTGTNLLEEALIDGAVYPTSTTPVSITAPSSVPTLTQGVAMTPLGFVAAGGSGTYVWTRESGALPAGLAFTQPSGSQQGRLAGTPTASGSFGPIVIRATDATDATEYAELTINISVTAAGALTISGPSTVPTLYVNRAMDPVELTTAGGAGGAKTITATTTLPAGTTLVDHGDGTATWSGTPTATQAAQTETFKVVQGTAQDTLSYSVKVDPEPTLVQWPPQDINKGFGITLNGPNWSAHATTLWNALTSQGRTNWQFARIELRGDAMEPTAGSYSLPAAVTSKVNWCKNRMDGTTPSPIRPVIDYTYHPWFYVQRQTFGSCTVTRVDLTPTGPTRTWRGKVYVPGSAFRGNYEGLTIEVPNVAHGTTVRDQGSDSDGAFVILSVDAPAAALGTNKTVLFGPYRDPGGTVRATEQDKHMGVQPSKRPDVAKAVAEAAWTYRAADPVFEYFNEGNAQFWRPAQSIPDYAETFRHIYRAVLEVDPSIHVATTGAANTASSNPNGWSYTAHLFIPDLFAYMKADATWQTWVTQTTATASSRSVSSNNLKALKDAGRISGRFYADYWGWHMYAFSRSGSTLGADNHATWLNTGPDSIAARLVSILNALNALDPTTGKTGLAKMMGISTETGTPWHPDAKTGQGALVADFPDLAPPDGPGPITTTASDEEGYTNQAVIFRKLYWKEAWTTGSGIAAYEGPLADPNRHLAIIIYQRLEEIDETYAGAAAFYHQGIFDRAGNLKRSSRTSRQYLNSGRWANSVVGSGVDMIDAFNRNWN